MKYDEEELRDKLRGPHCECGHRLTYHEPGTDQCWGKHHADDGKIRDCKCKAFTLRPSDKEK
jgi:hypothetical protein